MGQGCGDLHPSDEFDKIVILQMNIDIIMIFQMRHKDNEGEILEPVNAKRADAAMRACPGEY